MKKFIIFCLMAFMVCLSANAQQSFEEGIYQLQQATSKRLTNEEYNAVKEFAIKSGNTFHFEYEPTMYAKGVYNQRIGYNMLLLLRTIHDRSSILSLGPAEQSYWP